MRTTPGRYLIQQALPDRFKQFDGALDAKAASALFTQMAKELSPEEYKQVTYRLNNLGNTIASEYGGVASIHLRDLRLPDNLRAMRDALQKKVYAISQDPRLSSQERKRAIIRTVQEATPAIDKAVLETLGSTDNSFGLQVKPGYGENRNNCDSWCSAIYSVWIPNIGIFRFRHFDRMGRASHPFNTGLHLMEGGRDISVCRKQQLMPDTSPK